MEPIIKNGADMEIGCFCNFSNSAGYTGSHGGGLMWVFSMHGGGFCNFPPHMVGAFEKFSTMGLYDIFQILGKIKNFLF